MIKYILGYFQGGIMKALAYFFRGVEDTFEFRMFTPIHISLLLVWILGIVLIFKYIDKLKKYKVLQDLGIILLIDQFILYSWQFGSGYFNIEQSLPLFHCRMAVWLIIISIFTNNRRTKAVGMYWGMAGTLVGMLLVDLYHFSFPHYTNFQFFIVHLALGYVAAYYIADGYVFTKKDLITTIKFTNLYNFLTILLNLLLVKYYPQVNYGYLMQLPPSLAKGFPLTGIPYTIFIMLLMNGLILFAYFTAHFLAKVLHIKEKHERQ